MNSLLHVSRVDRLMTNGLVNFPSCMFKTGRMNLDVRLVKEYWGRILPITGQMRTMSKSN